MSSIDFCIYSLTPTDLVELALLLHGAPVLVGDTEPLRVPWPDVDVYLETILIS